MRAYASDSVHCFFNIPFFYVVWGVFLRTESVGVVHEEETGRTPGAAGK
jgi:hypothetical protein